LLNQLTIIAANHSEVKAFMCTLRQAIYTTISDACDEPDSLSAPQVKELLKLSLLAVRQTKRVTDDPADLQAVWDAHSLVALSTKLESSRFKSAASLQGLCKQLHAVIGGGEQAKSGNQKKRKAEDTRDDTDVKKARRKKIKKSRD